MNCYYLVHSLTEVVQFLLNQNGIQFVLTEHFNQEYFLDYSNPGDVTMTIRL